MTRCRSGTRSLSSFVVSGSSLSAAARSGAPSSRFCATSSSGTVNRSRSSEASRAESMNGGSARISSSMFSFSAAIEAVIASESSASCTIWPCRWSSDRMTTARLRVSSARSCDWSAAASRAPLPSRPRLPRPVRRLSTSSCVPSVTRADERTMLRSCCRVGRSRLVRTSLSWTLSVPEPAGSLAPFGISDPVPSTTAR